MSSTKTTTITVSNDELFQILAEQFEIEAPAGSHVSVTHAPNGGVVLTIETEVANA